MDNRIIKFGKDAARSVDEYWEYNRQIIFNDFFHFNLKLEPIILYRIVGNDDGGKLFTPDEYENYKKEVLPMV